jgi:phosphotransferase system  glucose/maltose/N-acetylglucosamine-specific IIC component
MEYRHTQWGYTAIPTFLLFAVIIPITAGDDETTVAITAMLIVFTIALLAIVLLFSRLEVTVSGGRIVTAFGFGRPHREVDLADVTAVRQVRNTWIQGWGIRKITGGWMYNVWGLDAVEVEISSDKVFRIGTNDPENLLATISLQIKR